MKVRDWCVICKTVGEQLSLEVCLGVWAAVMYFLADTFFLLSPAFMSIVKGVTAFLAAYYFVYCAMLTKKVIDKHFK
jgi:hypothetical protein